LASPPSPNFGVHSLDMARARATNGNHRKSAFGRYEFTVVLLPVFDELESVAKPSGAAMPPRKPLRPSGYQVTVPSLPGLVTFGRNRSEAWAMAEDAIRCHIEGLRKDGVPIPDEGAAQFRKLKISA
jgi:predicted RNase H-like HicB family nuclease